MLCSRGELLLMLDADGASRITDLEKLEAQVSYHYGFVYIVVCGHSRIKFVSRCSTDRFNYSWFVFKVVCYFSLLTYLSHITSRWVDC